MSSGSGGIADVPDCTPTRVVAASAATVMTLIGVPIRDFMKVPPARSRTVTHCPRMRGEVQNLHQRPAPLNRLPADALHRRTGPIGRIGTPWRLGTARRRLRGSL